MLDRFESPEDDEAVRRVIDADHALSAMLRVLGVPDDIGCQALVVHLQSRTEEVRHTFLVWLKGTGCMVPGFEAGGIIGPEAVESILTLFKVAERIDTSELSTSTAR